MMKVLKEDKEIITGRGIEFDDDIVVKKKIIGDKSQLKQDARFLLGLQDINVDCWIDGDYFYLKFMNDFGYKRGMDSLLKELQRLKMIEE